MAKKERKREGRNDKLEAEQQAPVPEYLVTATPVKVPGVSIKCPRCGMDLRTTDASDIANLMRGGSVLAVCPQCRAVMRAQAPRVQAARMPPVKSERTIQ